jgi:8-amino-7-oxononanoate synthase
MILRGCRLLTAVVLTSTLIRDYLLNYARPFIYTTSLSKAAILAASCSFDLLEDGTAEKVRASFRTFTIRPRD